MKTNETEGKSGPGRDGQGDTGELVSQAHPMRGNAVKMLVFPIGFLALFVALGVFFQPVWMSWNNFSTFRGFYDEPRDTVETIFLGPSSTVTGVDPMGLYEEYGICAYNLGSEQQPFLASYYWLKEAYRYHPNSLKTVVLQCVELKYAPNIAFYRKAIDAMRPSAMKWQAVSEYAELKKDQAPANGAIAQAAKAEGSGRKSAYYYYFPLLGYHDRWSSLGKDDFLKGKYPVEAYARGYLFSMGRYQDSQSYASMSTPPYVLDEGAEAMEPDGEALDYLNRMVAFCEEKGLRLILTSMPCSSSASEHNMISGIAQANGLEYLDFDYPPISEEMDFNRAVDTMDGGHMNYYGASKTMEWIGRYLRDQCGATDVRGDSRFSFMEEELEAYRREVTDVVALKEERNLCEYLRMAARNEDYAIFLSVRDDGSAGLQGEDTRQALASLGLQVLSALGFRAPYLALLERGKVVFEATGEPERNLARIGRLQNGRPYSMNSGGADSVPAEGEAALTDKAQKGMIASCVVDGAERAANSRGINVVIYNERTGGIVDSVAFDTYVSPDREAGYLPDLLRESSAKPFAELSPMLQKLSLYNYRCGQARKLAELLWGGEDAADGLEGSEDGQEGPEDELLSLLEAFQDDGNVFAYITAKGDASAILTADGRRRLAALGLEELSRLGEGESYVGALHGGKAHAERRGQGAVRAEYGNARMCSGGADPAIESYVMTDNGRKDVAEPGINVVLYDRELRMVIHVAHYA